MKYTLKAYSIWEQGPREKQEDSIFPKHGEIVDTDRLFILCDGMGGHSAGEIASATVCSTMSNYILHNAEPNGDFTDDDFMAALNAAYDALDEKDNGAAKKMGTTLTFLKFHNLGCTIAHIGDSRVYHIRPGRNVEDTEILFQTEDHSLVNDLVRIGELTREEAKHSKQKNVITRAMQPCMERRSKADIYHCNDIKSGDYFMLCSDGILEQMEDENLKFIFSAKGGDITNKINIITKATAQNHDNHSAIIIKICSNKETSKHSIYQMIKDIAYLIIIGALIGCVGFYLYKTLKNRKDPIQIEAGVPMLDENNPSKPAKKQQSQNTQQSRVKANDAPLKGPLTEQSETSSLPEDANDTQQPIEQNSEGNDTSRDVSQETIDILDKHIETSHDAPQSNQSKAEETMRDLKK